MTESKPLFSKLVVCRADGGVQVDRGVVNGQGLEDQLVGPIELRRSDP